MIDPTIKYPMANINRLCFLKNIVTNPNVIIGDYNYYDDPESVLNFNKNVLYRKRHNLSIQKLIELAWWDWSFEKITKHANEIAGGDYSLLT